MKIELDDLFVKLENGDVSSLSRAITIIESKAKKHKEQANKLLSLANKNKKQSLRIGISGMPGAGKSTFIDAFGSMLIEFGHKVAVLAVDPSSTVSKGSILGDKTRMEELSLSTEAFIRPSPSGGYLGGTASKTREIISLCEAANYDIILVETVGIGQSETEVKTMVDFFLLLILPAGGDELQGIKKGAVELADMVIVNKSDGDKIPIAKRTKLDYMQAIKILGQSNKFSEKVFLCSALEKNGLNEIWEEIFKFTHRNNFLEIITKERLNQDKYWIDKTFENTIVEFLFQDKDFKIKLDMLKSEVLRNETNLESALEQLQKMIFR